MNIIGELVAKILETPEVVNQIKKSLVNRDLAVEIDGKRFQIMQKRDDDEIDNLKSEVIMVPLKWNASYLCITLVCRLGTIVLEKTIFLFVLLSSFIL